jgi:hypothetical protein
VKTLFAAVLLFDMIALSGASLFIMKPTSSTKVHFAQSFASDSQTFLDPLDFGARKRFGR